MSRSSAPTPSLPNLSLSARRLRTILPSWIHLLVALAALVALLALVVVTVAPPATSAHGARSFKPCVREDGPGPCVWDAKHRGNGLGTSFILRRDGRVDYITHRRAHRISQ